jgi:hypothetical protein
MKFQAILLGCVLALISLASACKKAEQPTAPAVKEDQAAPAQTPTAAPQASAPAPDSGVAVVLKPKWPVGSRSVYRMETEQQSTNRVPQLPTPMQQRMRNTMTYALTVLKETLDGGREVELEILDNSLEIAMGGQTLMSFDSKKPAPAAAGPQDMIMGPFRKMAGSKVRLQFSPDGKLEEVLNLDEWIGSLTGGAQNPAGAMVAQQFNEDYFRQLAQFNTALPRERVAVGQTWPFETELSAGPMGKIKAEATTALKGVEEHEGRKCAVLETKGIFQGGSAPGAAPTGPVSNVTVEEGTLNSSAWFDPEEGALVESTTTQSMRLKGAMPGGASADAQFASAMTQTTRMKLVERTAAKP